MKPGAGDDRKYLLVGDQVESGIMNRRRSRCSQRLTLLLMSICLFCLVILVLIFVYQSPEVRVLNMSPAATSNQEPLTIEEIVSNVLIPTFGTGKWISDTELMYVTPCTEHEECETLFVIKDVSNSDFGMAIKIDNGTKGVPIAISSDRKFLLLSSNRKHLFRLSTTARFDYFNISSSQEIAVMEDDDEISVVEFGPRGTQSVIVRSGDLYYKESIEHNNTVVLNHVASGPGGGYFLSNGVPDWMYEEEILRSDRSFWFSPSGKKLAYLSIDGSDVPYANVLRSGESVDQDSIYLSYPYPQPGGNIPVVSLCVVDLDTDDYETDRLQAPKELEVGGSYFTGAVWVSDDHILVSWMSRNQSLVYLMSCMIVSTSEAEKEKVCRYILQEDSVQMWTDPIVAVPSDDGSKIAVVQQNEETDAHEIVVLDFSERHLTVTQADLDVTKVHAFVGDFVYFEAIPESDPLSKHVYRAHSRRHEDVSCLTCDYPACDYNEAIFSPAASFFIHRCFGPAFPFSQIVDTMTGVTKIMLEENKELKDRLTGKKSLASKVMEIPVTDFWNATLKLYFPSCESPCDRQLPLLLHVYNGPESVSVTAKHASLEDPFGIFMAQKEDVIFAKVDVRGSGNRGLSRLREIYGHLGDVEVTDILTVVDFIQQNVPQVDGKRMAIYGSSYGGFVVLRSLIQDQKSLLRCGFAFAPVVDWRLYDAFYSEKFLSSPQSNEDAYDKSSVLLEVDRLKGKKIMIAHGSSDDNVYVQNSLKLVKSLIDKGIEHDFLLLPDESHYLRNRGMKTHLLHSMHRFFTDCFSREDGSHHPHHQH